MEDEGFLLLGATSILHGQWPMADFFSYQPLSYFFLATFFKLFGNSVFTERLALMGLILINVWMIEYCALKLLPSAWAWMPAAVYAFAPGPWYKVFFISHLLLSLVTVLYLLERPSVARSVLLGFTAGLAAIGRVEASAVIVVLVVGFLVVYVWLGDDVRQTYAPNGLSRLSALLRLEGSFALGLVVPVVIVLMAYWGAGKLPLLLQHIGRYYNLPYNIGFVNAISGFASRFSLKDLFVSRSGEAWAYAIAMLTCAFSVWHHGLGILVREARSKQAFAGLAVAIFGVGSLGYTYFYVWNTRMLSSFAIVYINYIALLFLARQKLAASTAARVIGGVAVAVGFAMVFLYLKSFIFVQIYSGSYTTNVPGAMATVHVPVLKGIYIYAVQADDIIKIRKVAEQAPPGSYLVCMWGTAAIQYITGLPDPTYYRFFSTEFAPPGEQQRAIGDFERYHIPFVVVRKSLFSEAGRYLPQFMRYLIQTYRPVPLGNNFVLLERRPHG